MSCVSNLSSGLRSLSADSATGTPSWITPARPCAGLTHIDVALVISQVVGNARVAVVVDFFTTDPNKPTSRVTVGSPVTASAKLSRDLTTDAQNNAFYRVGLLPSLSSGTTPGSIGVSLTGSVKSCGMVLARETVVVGPIPVGHAAGVRPDGVVPGAPVRDGASSGPCHRQVGDRHAADAVDVADVLIMGAS